MQIEEIDFGGVIKKTKQKDEQSLIKRMDELYVDKVLLNRASEGAPAEEVEEATVLGWVA